MLRKPVKIVVRRAGMRTPSGLSQEVRMVEDSTKAAELEKLLDESFDGGRVLCFCSTRRRCDALTRSLRSNGWPALGTHGHKCQIERDWVMRVWRLVLPAGPLELVSGHPQRWATAVHTRVRIRALLLALASPRRLLRRSFGPGSSQFWWRPT